MTKWAIIAIVGGILMVWKPLTLIALLILYAAVAYFVPILWCWLDFHATAARSDGRWYCKRPGCNWTDAD